MNNAPTIIAPYIAAIWKEKDMSTVVIVGIAMKIYDFQNFIHFKNTPYSNLNQTEIH